MKQVRNFSSSSPAAGRTRAAPAFFQPRLSVNRPGDAYEQEADAVADAVVRREQAGQTTVRREPLVQRKCAACAEEEKLQREAGAEEEAALQAKGMHPTDGGVAASPELSDELAASKGRGAPLPAHTLADMSRQLGADFSGVRIHTGAPAAAMSRSIQAKAFTHGSDIYFNQGHYDPGASEGRRLLAHELVHVVQQRAAPAALMRVPDESGVEQTPRPRYSYSTNCGWIDWSHADAGMTSRLVQAVQDASDRMSASGATTPEPVQAPRMESRGGPVFLSGVTPIVHIKRPLSSDEVLRVALRIFMLQSLGFEALQSWTDAIGSSSFSEEDLPSNLLAFYMGARGFDRTHIETSCDVWDITRSLAKFNGYTFSRNGSFRPMSLPAGGAWPADLSTITPAVAGGPLMDLPEGRFDTTMSTFNRGLIGYEIITSGSLRIVSRSGGTTIDISGTTSGAADGPHFEVQPLPGGHNLLGRWIIRDSADRRYLMRGNDESSVFRYGTQFDAYINAPTRQLLRDRGITEATILCRVRVGAEGEDAAMSRVLELPVTFTW